MTNSCDGVWKKCLLEPRALKKDSCNGREEKAGRATAWGGAGQGRVFNVESVSSFRSRNMRGAEIRSS